RRDRRPVGPDDLRPGDQGEDAQGRRGGQLPLVRPAPPQLHAEGQGHRQPGCLATGPEAAGHDAGTQARRTDARPITAHADLGPEADCPATAAPVLQAEAHASPDADRGRQAVGPRAWTPHVAPAADATGATAAAAVDEAAAAAATR